MTTTAGIKSITNISYDLIGEIKQTVLLFDIVGIPQLDTVIKITREKHKPDCVHNKVMDELEFLKDKGLLFNSFGNEAATPIRIDADIKSIGEEFHTLNDILKNPPSMQIGMDAAVRLSCLLLNNDTRKQNFNAIPLVKDLNLGGDRKATRASVINLIIEQMPIPDEKTPWENILEFKSNSDNIGRFAGLRNWVNKAVRSGNTSNEIKDELEYLLHQYRKNLEAHNIKFNSGIIQSLIVGGAELLENAAKLKFSEIAKGLFSTTQSHADLLKAELTSPGHDLAYIYQANQKFQSDKNHCK